MMPTPMTRSALPRSLFSRVTLIIIVGLVLAQLMTFGLIQYERGVALRELMMNNIERDIASSIVLLDRLPAAERQSWFAQLERRNYRFVPEGPMVGMAPDSERARAFAKAISDALRPYRVEQLVQVAEPFEGLRVRVRLSDGATIDILAARVGMPVSAWVMWVLLIQLLVLILCAWLAVRLVTRPLAALAAAADDLGPDLKARTLSVEGPTEVAHAARAFNAMQARIAGYMAERVEILAAISHDLQTPITRMRLRTELMDEGTDRRKLRQDLDAMQALVRQGLSYARTLHGASEQACRVDADALLESMVADYEDSGQTLSLLGRVGTPLVTRPIALRRILSNLIDNALKFGSEVVVQVQERRGDGGFTISVLDRGPGIPIEQLQAVLQPFYRVEGSRDRSTGGTGLGLAIAQQLAMAIGAELLLQNRAGGGLEARLSLQNDITSTPGD